MIFKLENKNETILFWIGVLIKITLGTFLGSHYISDFFIPFINHFVHSGFENTYQFFHLNGQQQAFPYPALMLYIFAIPKFLLGWIYQSDQVTFFSLFLFRIPLLFADLTIFAILKSWLRGKSFSKLIWFYWLSPVLVYISYIHGQLDVIPTSLLFISLHFLFQDHLLKASIFLAMAVATKTHIMLTLPFFFFYLFSKDIPRKKVLFFCIAFLISYIIPNLPYVFDPSFFKMVFQNPEQNKLFNSYISISGQYFYLIPASLLLLFVKGGLLRNYNRDIFIMFLGFSFAVVLLFISPMQGWYFWLIPFLAYFYIKVEGRSPYLFFGLQALYLLYFTIFKNADYLEVFQFINPTFANNNNLYAVLLERGFNVDQSVGIVFTGLQTMLLINCLWIYLKGIESYKNHKLSSTPFLIGIGGDSGVGKTTLTEGLTQAFSPQRMTVLRGDDMHRWQRGHSKWQEFTHLDPKANHLHLEINTFKKLKAGRKVYRRHYDHSTGTFTTEKTLKPNNIIIFEGLHPFYIEEQRKQYDLKVFIRPETNLMLHWKIVRDTKKRGYSKEEILKQIEKRSIDSKSYIEIQSEHADVLIEPKVLSGIKNIGDLNEDPEIYYNLEIINSISIEYLIEALSSYETLQILHFYKSNDKQTIELRGKLSKEIIFNLVDEFIPGLQDLGISSPSFEDDLWGIVILLVTYCVFEKAENE